MTSDSHLPQSLRALCVTERQDLESASTSVGENMEPSRNMFHHSPPSRLQVPRSIPRLQRSPIIHGRDGSLLDLPSMPRPRERSPGFDFWEKMSKSPDDNRRGSRPYLDRRLSSMSPMDQTYRRASRSCSPIDTPSFERRASLRDGAQTRRPSLHPAPLPVPHHPHTAADAPFHYMYHPSGNPHTADPNNAYSGHHHPEIDRRHSYQPEAQYTPSSTRPNTSYESVQPGGRVQIKRRSMACVACKEKKIRCESLDGQTWPCLRCRKRDIPCEFPGAQKKRGPQPGTTRPNTSTSARKGSTTRKATPTPNDTTPAARPALSSNLSLEDRASVGRSEQASTARPMSRDDSSARLRPIPERQQEHSGRSVTPAFETDLPPSTSARNSIGSLDSSLLTPEEEQDERRDSYGFGSQTATYRPGTAGEYLQVPPARSFRLGSGDLVEGRKHSIDFISSPDASRRGSLHHSGSHIATTHAGRDRPPMALPAPALRSPWQYATQKPTDPGQPPYATAHLPSSGPIRAHLPLDPHRRASAPHSGLFDAAYSLDTRGQPSRFDPRSRPAAKRQMPNMGEESMFGPDGLTLPPLEGLTRAPRDFWKQ